MEKRNKYGFKEGDVLRNEITKKLSGLLPTLDPKISWVDYVPGDALVTRTPLVAIGFGDGVKYVNVDGLSPFKMVNEVMNALDDYCLPVQFLGPRSLSVIQEDLERLAIDRTEVTANALSVMKSFLLKDEDFEEIIRNASEMGILPKYFPDENAKAKKEVLREFLKHSRATFMDTQTLAMELEEKLLSRIQEKENDALIGCLDDITPGEEGNDCLTEEPELD